MKKRVSGITSWYLKGHDKGKVVRDALLSFSIFLPEKL